MIQRVKIKWNIGALLVALSARLYSMPRDPIPLILALNWRKKNIDLINIKWQGNWIFEKIIDALKLINNEIRILND